MTADLSALIARLEAGPVYLTHKEAYDLAIFFGSDEALGMASMIRKAFVGASLDAALALAERLGMDGCRIMYAALMNWKAHDPSRATLANSSASPLHRHPPRQARRVRSRRRSEQKPQGTGGVNG